MMIKKKGKNPLCNRLFYESVALGRESGSGRIMMEERLIYRVNRVQ